MMQSFSLGVRQLWGELSSLQLPGFYWVNIDRQEDASLFCQQLISVQQPDARVALIGCGENIQPLFSPLSVTRLKQLPCYILPQEKAALISFTDDLMRTLKPRKRLFILYAPASLWQDFTPENITRWVTETGDWLHQRQCTLIVLSHGSGVGRLKNMLISQHRALYGLSSLQWQQDRAQYLVSWWSMERGMNANQVQMLQPETDGWRMVVEDESVSTPFLGDDGLYLAEKSVLEGAPALSESWQVFDNSEILTQRGMLTHAATLIFALNHTSQVNTLARQVHSLRRQRGNMLKIVVREMKPCLRASDERLLLACGANVIVVHTEPLSRFLSRLESVQGQRFTRHVPLDIETLLTMMRPLQIKGYLPPNTFRLSVQMLIDNIAIPEGGKGILIALRPVPGLRIHQSLTLCNIRRLGDIVTIARGRLFLFLSSCRMNELDTALKSIFRLPVDEIFSNRLVWSQDLQIVSEINMLSESNKNEPPPLANDYLHLRQSEPEQKSQAVRHQPTTITLLNGDQREKA